MGNKITQTLTPTLKEENYSWTFDEPFGKISIFSINLYLDNLFVELEDERSYNLEMGIPLETQRSFINYDVTSFLMYEVVFKLICF